jgi:hypothetical protein
MVLVDGKQRLTAVRRFIADELLVFGGQRLSEFADNAQFLRSLGSGLKFHVNHLPTRAAVLTWYLELNTGGTPHAEDEIARVRALLAQEQLQ